MNNIAIQCHQIIKSYGKGKLKTEVLHGIDLNVKQGELLMLVGPSGSGKTTLISIMAGILSYEGGECIVLGKNFSHMSDEEKATFRGKSIGFVFQAFNLIPMLTSQENVSIPILLSHRERKEALELAKSRLSQFNLSHKITTYPTFLSVGEQQRVAIARAVIHNPEIIVCDEPTSSLDAENGQLVLSHLREIVTKEKRTIIVVTHDSRIFNFADRIVTMDDGRLKEGK